MHYQVHLDEGGPADSLEVLLVSLALDTPINVIMSDEVWCTARSGLDFQYSIVVLTWGGTRLCKVEDSDQYLGDIDTSAEKATDSVKDEDCVPQPLLEHPKGGHPLAKSHLDSSRPTAIFNNSESSLSDIDSLFVADNTVKAVSRPILSGVSLPQDCLVCDISVASKIVLVYYLKYFHSGCHPYQCVKCDSHFNNGMDLGCHITNLHLGKKLQCKVCAYRTVNRS